MFYTVTDSVNRLDTLGGRKHWSRGDTSRYSSFHTNRTLYVSWQSRCGRGRVRRSVFVCVCVCAQLCEHICVGLCQEMAELSGRRCLLHSLAVGVSIMRLTEGCLCVGDASQHSANVYVQYVCVCAPSECVFSKCTIISSVCQFSMVTKGGYSSYSPMAARDVLKPPNTLAHSYAHIHRALTQQTVACVVTVYLMIWVLCVIFCIVQSFCQGEGEANCLPRNVCL